MRLLLGVTGGIAAYKAADLVSQAVKAGFEVRVVMTPSATQFVGPLTFEALSGQPVLLDTFATGGTPDGASAIQHIAWAKWATHACIAPLSASSLGKLAMGIADNVLTTTWLALPANLPNYLAPAMNTQMWEHPIVQRNLRWLDETGRYTVIFPTSKRLACGDVGLGALAEVSDILGALLANTAPAPAATPKPAASRTRTPAAEKPQDKSTSVERPIEKPVPTPAAKSPETPAVPPEKPIQKPAAATPEVPKPPPAPKKGLGFF